MIPNPRNTSPARNAIATVTSQGAGGEGGEERTGDAASLTAARGVASTIRVYHRVVASWPAAKLG
jgi:hypothetical protein